MKYKKPNAEVVDFRALQQIAYISEDNGAKTADDSGQPTTSLVGGSEDVQERD